MSRTRKIQRVENPAEGFLSFHGGLGKIGFREKGSDKMEEMETPIEFVVIDADCRKIGGKVDPNKKKSDRFNSNLSHFGYGVNEFTVITEKNDSIVDSGKWSSIKKNPALAKAKYTQLIFACFEVSPDNFKMYRISLHGRALSEWIEISKKYPPVPTDKNPQEYLFKITGFKTVSSEENELESEVPIFEVIPLNGNEQILSVASDMDQNYLQPYFEYYFKELVPQSGGTTDAIDNEAEEETEFESEEENLPWENEQDEIEQAIEQTPKRNRR